MSEYTITLRRIMETEQGKTLLENALSTYPLYEPKKLYDMIPTREQLNTKLLNRYKYREIGFDTVGRFLDELEISMCEIMPRYNELFKSVEIMADLPNPFDNVDVVETFEQTTSNSASSEGTTTDSQNGSSSSNRTGTDTENASGSTSQTSNGKRLESDTPQDSLTIGTKDIDSVNYASLANWSEDTMESESSTETSKTSSENITGTTENESTGTSSSSSESSGTVSHTFTKKGNQGVNTYAHDMNEFRTSIIDIIGEILEDSRITELFMLVY